MNTQDNQIELSVVIPCLNEAETVGICIEKAFEGIRNAGIVAEVILADNGSTDGSREIAEKLGARVVPVSERGYGNALIGGIKAAHGKYVIMGDADDSYDFREIPRFVPRLREGNALVMGCRLPSGGGTVMPGAMPFLHRWWGNPMFSRMARIMFRYPGHDVYCGLRGFDKELFNRLNINSPGMEFAVEMVIKSSVFGERIAEVPITLHPDGRKLQRPHLRTFRDGWRTLRTFLAFSPKWLFAVPSMAMLAIALVGYSLSLPGLTVGPATFGAHTLLLSSLSLLLAQQMFVFALSTQVAAASDGLIPESARVKRWLNVLQLERVLVVAGLLSAVGCAGILWMFLRWSSLHFGALDYAQTMRVIIPSVTLIALGVQSFMAGFYLHMVATRRGR
jgi:glycosyltransferase involved in cell wall biosynthesis